MTDFEYDSPSPYNPAWLHVQNRRARALLEFAIETAEAYEATASDPEEVRRLSNWYREQFFDGMGIGIAEVFPSAGSRRFWCRVFFDVASRAFRRELGNRDVSHWQCAFICDAVTIARMLLQAAKDLEPQWVGPLPMDWADEAAWRERQPGA